MGKVGKARKRARRSIELNDGSGIDADASDIADPKVVTESRQQLDDEALRTTEQTLRLLLGSPDDLLRSRQARIIRSQAFAIVEALGVSTTTTTTTGSSGNVSFAKSVSGRIGDALHDGRWSDAMELLLQQVAPKPIHTSTSSLSSTTPPPPPSLGALQRWIRDLFETSKSCRDDISCHLLSLILTSTGQLPVGNNAEEMCLPGPKKVFPMWFATPRVLVETGVAGDEEDASWIEPDVEPVAIESAWKDGMTLWTNKSDPSSSLSLILDQTATTNATSRTDVPFVPGAFVLNQVISARECRRILRVAHRMGFTPEASYAVPEAAATTAAAAFATTSTSLPSASSTAADGVVWIADNTTLAELVARVLPLLPPEFCGGKLVGINARWRIYHYRVGTVYRPHIDGAWTGSGIVDGVYLKDIYSSTARSNSVTSRLTFLIYLNDDFEHGGTTFYAPAHEEKCIAARSVAPIQGSVLCFPHGYDVPNVGLVHEGSAVTKGSKYVLRSDVLYEVPLASRSMT